MDQLRTRYAPVEEEEPGEGDCQPARLPSDDYQSSPTITTEDYPSSSIVPTDVLLQSEYGSQLPTIREGLRGYRNQEHSFVVNNCFAFNSPVISFYWGGVVMQ